MISRKITRALCIAAASFLFLSQPLTALADKATEKEQRIAAHQALPIESNLISGWPTGPVVSAESAILIEAETGTILYEKGIHKKQYPASTTKILTALLAYENSQLDEVVAFSKADVFTIPRGSNNIAMDAGWTLSMDDCLHALLIRSANEVAYAMAAHVGGSWDNFADMMNKRAQELGAVDSNFVNPNGLPNEEHVTSAYDLAMIGRAFFANDYLTRITLEPKLVVEKPNGTLVDWNQMPLIPSGKYAYQYIVGCKTGYTDSAHNTMVSCAEKNGLRLICVVLNDDNPMYNEDSIALFEYGFSNFNKVNVSQTETKYDIDNIGFFYDNSDIFGEAQPILSLNKDDCVIIPKTASIADLTSNISYDVDVPGTAAVISYEYHGVNVGSVTLDIVKNVKNGYTFESEEKPVEPTATSTPTPEKKKTPDFFFINLKTLKVILIIAVIFAVLLGIYLFIRNNFHFSFASGLKKSRNHDYAKRSIKASNEIVKERKAAIREAKKRYKERFKRR